MTAAERPYPLDAALERVGKRLANLAREFPPMFGRPESTPTPWREKWIEWAFMLPEDVRKAISEAQCNIEAGRKAARGERG